MNVTKQLYQWDTGQKLTECTGIYVDYLIGDEVYRVEITDGTCIIPDELLQTSGSHTVYECMTNNTIQSFAFSVIPRPKPPEYVFTPTERLTFEGLVQKVDDAVADMIRRAESGEFDGHTPVKGTDYFTTAEIQQIQNEVSSGAIGDFKTVVDTETETFNNNAETKLNAYNQNDSQKTNTYNTNATEKLNAYNTNANNRVAEFDTHTEQIQTDISGLKSDLTGLQTVVDSKAYKSDLAKTNLYLDALFKLNRGQTWDTLEAESNAYAVDVPSGSHYASVDMVGGKSVVWNQLVNPLCFRATSTKSGLTFTNNGDGSITVSGTATSSGNIRLAAFYDSIHISVISGHKHYCKLPNAVERVVLSNDNNSISFYNENQILSMNVNGAVSYDLYFTSGVTYNYTFKPQIFDLTAMFGAGNEPRLEEFEAMFPADYYPYSEPTIISSQTDRVDVAMADSTVTQQITTGFPVLNSAGSVYDYIDLNEGKLHQRVGVVDLGTLNWKLYASSVFALLFAKIDGLVRRNGANGICTKYSLLIGDYNWLNLKDKQAILYVGAGETRVGVRDSAYADAESLKAAMSGVMLYYELAEPVITDITIPTELSDWLTVEAGGSVTFHNTDDGKRLLIPNKLSFVRKLDEVSV